MLRVERLTPAEWQRSRAIRLRSLRDTPDAFASTYDEEQSFADEVWRERLGGTAAVTFVVVLDGEDAGCAVGAPFRGRSRAAGLFAMWVAPSARGHGAGDALVEAVTRWARTAGFERLLLEVGDANARAITLYARNGFAPTGRTGSLPPPRQHIPEHERALVLADHGGERRCPPHEGIQ